MKNKLILLKDIMNDYLLRFRLPQPTIRSIDETINYIIENKCSVSRYGDGELRIIIGANQNFQNSTPLLQRRLSEILKSQSNNHIVCLSDCFGSLKDYTFAAKKFYIFHMSQHRKDWYQALQLNKIYYNTDITRFYMSFKRKDLAEQRFNSIKRIWENRDIIIVEGEKSRLGVGNDLFNNCKSIKRVLCPAENAFDKYEEIIEYFRDVSQNNLILIALGPTATVLAYDLSIKGYQALDIGHLDIEYEWFRRGLNQKEKIPGKYVNEAHNGNIVEDIDDVIYMNQIDKIIA